MARALARGWGDPVLCSDSGSGRARGAGRGAGRRGARSNVEVAERADLVVLCHKPRAAGRSRPRSAGTSRPSPRCSAAPRSRRCRRPTRACPCSVDAQHAGRGPTGRGLLRATPTSVDPRLERRVGAVRAAGHGRAPVHERLMTPAAAVRASAPPTTRCSPRPRSTPPCATGCGRRWRGGWSPRRWPGPPRCSRRATTTRWRSGARSPRPAASTARGLEALERGGVRAAFQAAIDAVIDGGAADARVAITRTDIANYVARCSRSTSS